MIFARYIGGGGPGSFVKKKTYVIQKEEGDAVNLNDVCILDEEGERVCFNPEEDHRFEFCEKVFGVLLKEFRGLPWKRGKVVVIDDAASSKKGTFFGVESPGKEVFLDDSYFQILDHSNIVPGMEVKDVETGAWLRIERVSGAMWVQVHGSDDLRPLTDYQLAVSDGEIDMIRLAKCINDAGISTLTKDKQYRVVCERECIRGGSWIEIESDDGCIYIYDVERFEFP